MGGMRGRLLLPIRGMLAFLLVLRCGSAKKSKRWTYPRPQWQVPAHRMNPSPCRVFVWDAASARKFCTCTRLLEISSATSLWQDTHKQLWLRLPYGSRLLTLFPCQQHSISRCARCGHEYKNHLRSAVERRRNRPFDKLLEGNASEARRKLSEQAAPSLDFRRPPLGRTFGGNNNGDSTGGKYGETFASCDWGRLLAFVAEAQRSSLFQLSGIGVTSESARMSFDRVRKGNQGVAHRRDWGLRHVQGRNASSVRSKQHSNVGGRRGQRRGGKPRIRDADRNGEIESDFRVGINDIRALERTKYVRS